MRVVLKGLHTVKKQMADGSTRKYYYAWRGGPGLKSDPSTPEFIAEFGALTKKIPPAETLAGLVFAYKASRDFEKLSDVSKRDYAPFLAMICDEFGTMPVEALNETGPRGMFKEWRDGMAANPRKADRAWAVLRRVFSWAMDAEKIIRNPCDRGGRLWEGSRAEIIWTAEQIAAVDLRAPECIRQAMMLALWTGQRQGDLLRLTWTAYDGTHIRLKQSKGGKRVTILVYSDLKQMLDGMKRTEGTILVNSRGKPWTSDGFKTSWGKTMKKIGVAGVTFHDLRGTFITAARRVGAEPGQIAAASGHSTKDVDRILERHYLAHDQATNDAVILKMERAKKRTKR
jgi:integrase